MVCSRKKETLDAATELFGFQILYAESRIAQETDSVPAKRFFERNLAIDPITHPSHGLYNAFIRTCWNILQGWLACLYDDAPTSSRRQESMNDFLKTMKVEKLMRSVPDSHIT